MDITMDVFEGSFFWERDIGGNVPCLDCQSCFYQIIPHLLLWAVNQQQDQHMNRETSLKNTGLQVNGEIQFFQFSSQFLVYVHHKQHSYISSLSGKRWKRTCSIVLKVDYFGQTPLDATCHLDFFFFFYCEDIFFMLFHQTSDLNFRPM